MPSILSGRILVVSACVVIAGGVLRSFDPHEQIQGQGDRPGVQLTHQTSHRGGIRAVAYRADGRHVATASDDSSVVLWNAISGRAVQRFSGHFERVNSVAFVPDRDQLVTGSSDRTLRIWDTRTGAQINQFAYDHEINSVAVSPDGRYFLTGSNSGARLLDASSGKQIHRFGRKLFLELFTNIPSVAFSPDGRYAIGSSGRSTWLWEAVSARVVHELEGHMGDVTAVAFSADGRWIVTSSEDTTVALFDVVTGRMRSRFTGLPGPAAAVSISPDGRLVAGGAKDGPTFVWNVESGRRVGELKNAVGVNALAFSPDSRELVEAGFGYAVISDLSIFRPVNVLGLITPQFSNAFAVSPDGTRLLVGTLSGPIFLLDLVTGDVKWSFEGHTEWINSIVFTQDGTHVLTSSRDGTVRMWNVASGREIRRFAPEPSPVVSLALSPDGRYAAGGSEQGLTLWDARTGEHITRFRRDLLAAFASDVTQVDFHARSPYVLGSFWDSSGGIRIWDADTRKEIRNVGGQLVPLKGFGRGHTDRITSAAFSVDGERVISSSWDKTVRAWNLRTGDPVWRLDHDDQVALVKPSPDGRFVFSASARSGLLSDPRDGRLIRPLRGPWNGVRAAAFTRDGRTLIVLAADFSVSFWDTASGDLSFTYVPMANRHWVAYTPDGLFDGTAKGWESLGWRFGADDDSLATEVFFQDFFSPGLVQQILTGRRPRAPRALNTLDRRQPSLAVHAPAQMLSGPTEDSVRVEVEVRENRSGGTAGSGARDVRLFRNGSLVRIWRGDVLAGQAAVRLDATVKLVAGQNRLVAYAFNQNNVKSEDASAVVTGSETLRREPTAFIVPIGITEYTNPAYTLTFPAGDAAAFAGSLESHLKTAGTFKNVRQVPTLTNSSATKTNILSTLRQLGRTAVDRRSLSRSGPLVAQPEDAVFIFFAGHGFAYRDTWYLVPHEIPLNVGSDGSDATLQQLASVSISVAELEAELQNIDATHVVLIVDACNSGEVLESSERRRGPMNVKGFAQLAYEKGMDVAAASQGYQLARGSSRQGLGFLTYALVREGLATSQADVAPADGRVTVQEWLDFATRRVPELHAELIETNRRISERLRGANAPTPGGTGAERREPQDLQRPRVFYKRDPEAQILTVARVSR